MTASMLLLLSLLCCCTTLVHSAITITPFAVSQHSTVTAVVIRQDTFENTTIDISIEQGLHVDSTRTISAGLLTSTIAGSNSFVPIHDLQWKNNQLRIQANYPATIPTSQINYRSIYAWAPIKHFTKDSFDVVVTETTHNNTKTTTDATLALKNDFATRLETKLQQVNHTLTYFTLHVYNATGTNNIAISVYSMDSQIVLTSRNASALCQVGDSFYSFYYDHSIILISAPIAAGQDAIISCPGVVLVHTGPQSTKRIQDEDIFISVSDFSFTQYNMIYFPANRSSTAKFAWFALLGVFLISCIAGVVGFVIYYRYKQNKAYQNSTESTSSVNTGAYQPLNIQL